MASDLRAEVRDLAERIAEATDVTGILAIELFLAHGRLLLNEVATRPHNSGHYTIEGAVTSQFENHLRAVLDWPLGETSLNAPAVVTVNVVGVSEADPRANLRRALAVPGVHVHLYGKGPRPGRKLGHVTALGDDADEARERAWRAARLITGEETGGLP
jgi:5-(carboxyamino)imidazole ribonucleotide synthase